MLEENMILLFASFTTFLLGLGLGAALTFYLQKQSQKAAATNLQNAFNTLATAQAQPFLGGPGHHPLADRMHAEWTRFVKTGQAGWARYDLNTRPTLRFDTTSGVVSDPLAERRRLWAGVAFE